jgi:hypothetical protein
MERVSDFRHKAGMPYLCVINGGADTVSVSKSECDNGFYCNICATDLYCQRDADSIALSYVPVSYANTDKYNPAVNAKGSSVRQSIIPSVNPKGSSIRQSTTPSVNPKGSSIRGATTPNCPPCQTEYSWVLGTCYEDCNITAGIASCVNGQVVKNTGKGSFNYSMQITGLCNLDCPSGYTDIGTSCAVKPETRGAGTPLQCSGRWQQKDGGCYTPCNESAGIADWNGTTNQLVRRPGYDYFNYEMPTAGVCNQECPPGANDSGVFCYRQSYSRGIGEPKPT